MMDFDLPTALVVIQWMLDGIDERLTEREAAIFYKQIRAEIGRLQRVDRNGAIEVCTPESVLQILGINPETAIKEQVAYATEAASKMRCACAPCEIVGHTNRHGESACMHCGTVMNHRNRGDFREVPR